MLRNLILISIITFMASSFVYAKTENSNLTKKYIKVEEMKPEIVEQEKMLLAGVINCGKEVTEIDIHELWTNYGKAEKSISHIVPGKWYELHIGTQLGNGIYCVMAGVEIDEVVDLPVDVTIKIVPAGKYAHFSHCMKEDGYGKAFEKVENWLQEKDMEARDFSLQAYDEDFDPSNENSILHIYIPLVMTEQKIK